MLIRRGNDICADRLIASTSMPLEPTGEVATDPRADLVSFDPALGSSDTSPLTFHLSAFRVVPLDKLRGLIERKTFPPSGPFRCLVLILTITVLLLSDTESPPVLIEASWRSE